MSTPAPTTPADDPRDLRFEPVVNPSPRVLTQDQIAHYNQKGYISGIDLFDAYQADENRAYFDMLINRTLELGGSSYDVFGYHGRCQKLFDICVHWLLLEMVQDLIGANFLMWISHAFAKMPGETRTIPWHQDASYWDLTPARNVTAWIAIDDMDADNGPMQYIEGSHLLGHLPYTDQTRNTVITQEVADAARLGKIVDVHLRAGQLTLHSDLLVHGSGANLSSRRRCGLTMRYSPTYVRPTRGDWNQDIILCRGVDEYGFWGKPIRRPTGELIQRPDRTFKAADEKAAK